MSKNKYGKSIANIQWLNKEGSNWFICIKTMNDGTPVFSYHYKRKGAHCFPRIEINTKISKQLKGYLLMEKDINDAIEMLGEHNRRFNDSLDRGNDIILKSLMKAMAITYGKCFADTKGRKIKLGDQVISKTNMEAHEIMINMRHKYVAHADASVHESINLLLLCPTKKEVKKAVQGKAVSSNFLLHKELIQTTTSSVFTDGTINSLFDEVKEILSKKIKSLENKFKIDTIDVEKLWNLIKFKRSISLTDKLLNFLSKD